MTCYVPALTEKDPKRVILSVQQLAAGRSNATGIVTLTASATSTTVSDMNCAAGSVPRLTPTTSNAAAALTTTYIALASIVNGAFTITHASAATTDRTFLYAIQG